MDNDNQGGLHRDMLYERIKRQGQFLTVIAGSPDAVDRVMFDVLQALDLGQGIDGNCGDGDYRERVCVCHAEIDTLEALDALNSLVERLSAVPMQYAHLIVVCAQPPCAEFGMFTICV